MLRVNIDITILLEERCNLVLEQMNGFVMVNFWHLKIKREHSLGSKYFWLRENNTLLAIFISAYCYE